MSVLSAREAYRLWAPRYEAETAVSFLESHTVASLGASTAGRTLLDVGCGTARRLDACDAAFAVGVDLSREMLLVARGNRPVAAADVRALPIASNAFDVVWCRLMIGHVRDAAACYRELARVCAVGGTVIVSDLCPEAIAAGHRRTFRDDAHVVREIEHFVHTVNAQEIAARAAGLALDETRDGVVGPEIESFYVRAGRCADYEAQRGLPLVRVMAWRKRDTSP